MNQEKSCSLVPNLPSAFQSLVSKSRSFSLRSRSTFTFVVQCEHGLFAKLTPLLKLENFKLATEI
jgi:hypothetical protein